MFICIWCEDKKRGIGFENKIPWKVKEDMKLFKNLTIPYKIVMGKNTFLSLKKPLPQRENIVISSTLNQQEHKDIKIYKSVDDFLKDFKDTKEIIYIIGGKQLYKSFIDISDILVVSKLDDYYQCDVFMDNHYKNFFLKKVIAFDDFNNFIYVNKKHEDLVKDEVWKKLQSLN